MFLLIVGVAIVIASLYDTWWMGFIIGAVLGLVALVFRNADRMFQSAMQALGVVLVIAVLCGGIGYLYGHGALAKTGVGCRQTFAGTGRGELTVQQHAIKGYLPYAGKGMPLPIALQSCGYRQHPIYGKL